MKGESAPLGQAQKEAWGAFLLGHAALTRRMNRILQAEGKLSLQVYDLLLALEDAPGQRLRMSDLAACLAFDASSLTRLVDRLAELGFVCRESHPTDRRSVHACLTPLGLQARIDSWPMYRELIQEHFGRHLDDRAAQILRDALNTARGGDLPR